MVNKILPQKTKEPHYNFGEQMMISMGKQVTPVCEFVKGTFTVVPTDKICGWSLS